MGFNPRAVEPQPVWFKTSIPAKLLQAPERPSWRVEDCATQSRTDKPLAHILTECDRLKASLAKRSGNTMARRNKGVVGILGLGIMGGAFAQNLLAAGWRVVGYDTIPARRRAMAKLGAEIVDDAGELAKRVRTIITSLPKPSALADTAAVIAKAGLGRRIIVEMSTFALEDKAKAESTLRKAGHVMLDCPVSGTGAQAAIKDLVVYASGDPREIRKLRSLFADFTRAVHDVGAFGNGSRMKY